MRMLNDVGPVRSHLATFSVGASLCLTRKVLARSTSGAWRYSVKSPRPVFARQTGIGYDDKIQRQRDATTSEPAIDEPWVERERRIKRLVIASISGRRPVNPNVLPPNSSR